MENSTFQWITQKEVFFFSSPSNFQADGGVWFFTHASLWDKDWSVRTYQRYCKKVVLTYFIFKNC